MQQRVRAIIIQDKQLLAIEREKDGHIFWALPGGGIESFDLDSHAALQRECQEEVNLQIEVLLFVTSGEFNGFVENFFLCTPIGGEMGPGTGPEYNSDLEHENNRHIPVWLPLSQLRNYDLKPSAIKNMIIKNMRFYEGKLK